MGRPRVLTLGLDGLEIAFAERLMAVGEMPGVSCTASAGCALPARPRPRPAHGPRVGSRCLRALARGGTSLGRSGIRSDLLYDGVAGGRPVRSVVGPSRPAGPRLRHPLRGSAPSAEHARRRGVGAHDPGMINAASPHRLLAEFESRVGRYPASLWTYRTPFPSSTGTQAMGEALSRALGARSRAARWLATERLPNWDLFIAVAGELRGAVDAAIAAKTSARGRGRSPDERATTRGARGPAKSSRSVLGGSAARRDERIRIPDPPRVVGRDQGEGAAADP